jgi:hypothetical protein
MVLAGALVLLEVGGASAVFGLWPQPTTTKRPADTGIQSNFFIF